MTCSELPNTFDAPGHISGEKSCQDINYVERNEDFLVGVPGIRSESSGATLEWRDGKCREEGGVDPQCPPQEVPGFRC